MELKTEKIKIDAKELFHKALFGIKEKSGWILSFIFVLAIGYSIYLWYIYAFSPNWDDAKKQEYINTKQKDVNFDKDKFDSVITKIEQRKSNYQKNLSSTPDIFQFK
jgi:hypothetical protein